MMIANAFSTVHQQYNNSLNGSSHRRKKEREQPSSMMDPPFHTPNSESPKKTKKSPRFGRKNRSSSDLPQEPTTTTTTTTTIPRGSNRIRTRSSDTATASPTTASEITDKTSNLKSRPTITKPTKPKRFISVSQRPTAALTQGNMKVRSQSFTTEPNTQVPPNHHNPERMPTTLVRRGSTGTAGDTASHFTLRFQDQGENMSQMTDIDFDQRSFLQDPSWDNGSWVSFGTHKNKSEWMLNADDGTIKSFPSEEDGVDFGRVRRNETFVQTSQRGGPMKAGDFLVISGEIKPTSIKKTIARKNNSLITFQRHVLGDDGEASMRETTLQAVTENGSEESMGDIVKRLQKMAKTGDSGVLRFSPTELKEVQDGRKIIAFALPQLPRRIYQREEFGNIMASQVLRMTSDRPLLVEIQMIDASKRETNSNICFQRIDSTAGNKVVAETTLRVGAEDAEFGKDLTSLLEHMTKSGKSDILRFSSEDKFLLRMGSKRIIFVLPKVPGIRLCMEEFSRMSIPSILSLSKERPLLVHVETEDIVEGESLSIF